MQRAVLSTLDADDRRRWWTMAELARAAVGHDDRAAVESVRRAVKSLAVSGQIETDVFNDLSDVASSTLSSGYVADRPHFFARLSVEEASRW